MIYLEPGHYISGIAGAATSITVTIYGRRQLRSASVRLYQGQVPASATTLYTAAGEEVIIDEIHCVNPTAGAVTIKFHNSGTTDAFLILPSCSIAAGASLVYNQNGWNAYSATGQLRTTTT
jgi:hypothetical protein